MTLISYFWIRMTHISLLFEDEGPLSVMSEEHTVNNFPCVWAAWNKLRAPECLHLWQPVNKSQNTHRTASVVLHRVPNFTSKPRACVVCRFMIPAHHEVKLNGWKSHSKVRKCRDSRGYPPDCHTRQEASFIHTATAVKNKHKLDLSHFSFTVRGSEDLCCGSIVLSVWNTYNNSPDQ